MPQNVTQKLIAAHLLEGRMEPGEEIGLRIDQTLTQDATGTLVMLELEAMGIDRVRTEVSAQYVDHNVIQQDNRNPDDHLFLLSACNRFGVWYSRAGNGVSHPVHMERLGKPGKSLLGADSHTPAAGALGMLAIGAGGVEVAHAMAGEPFYLKMPQVWGVELVGELPPWVSAKDVILEMLRRHGVAGGLGRVIEYHGPGLAQLSAMDRHVIANMGAELGATTTVFPSDEATRAFLRAQGREEDWIELLPDPGCTYDVQERIDLSTLEPLIAKPSSPGNVVPVREVEGSELYQCYVGSSANPGYRDLAIVAHVVRGKKVPDGVSLDISPASRSVLMTLAREGLLTDLLNAGARLHQAGCNGCIGMGQAPALGRNSLRTVPRNFPGRSGTKEDSVWLCSPETAAASAIHGRITDPRRLGEYPRIEIPEPIRIDGLLTPPLPPENAKNVVLAKGPNIVSIPPMDPLPDRLEVEILLEVGDDVSTDEIMPAGARVLPYRSNIPAIAEFCFEQIDESYPRRARALGRPHAIVGGRNYGQGSSREHAALAPRYLGLRLVLAESFARIHRKNLANFGVLPLRFCDPADRERIHAGDLLVLDDIHGAILEHRCIEVRTSSGLTFEVEHDLTRREVDMVLSGGLLNRFRVLPQAAAGAAVQSGG